MQNNIDFRNTLISIESQHKKVVVVVVVVVVLVVIFVVVFLIVSHRNLSLKFDQNWVNDKWYIDVVFVVFAVVVVVSVVII